MSSTTLRIKRHKGRFKIDVKRLRLPFTIFQECPECGRACSVDLAKEDHIAFPLLKEPFNAGGYCSECGHEWETLVVLNVTLVQYKGPPSTT